LVKVSSCVPRCYKERRRRSRLQLPKKKAKAGEKTKEEETVEPMEMAAREQAANPKGGVPGKKKTEEKTIPSKDKASAVNRG